MWYDGGMPINLTPAQIQSVVSVIYKARTDQQVKLRFGIRKRTKMIETIGTPDLDKEDYRYKWLTTTRNAVIEFLGNKAKEFGINFPHDAVSVKDLSDVVESVVFLLKSHDEKS